MSGPEMIEDWKSCPRAGSGSVQFWPRYSAPPCRRRVRLEERLRSKTGPSRSAVATACCASMA